jgi:hypothetical protein
MPHHAAGAIREGCRRRQKPTLVEKVAPPLPAGLWQPDLNMPDPDCLAWYGRTYPLTHTYPPPTAGPDSTTPERHHPAHRRRLDDRPSR